MRPFPHIVGSQTLNPKQQEVTDDDDDEGMGAQNPISTTDDDVWMMER